MASVGPLPLPSSATRLCISEAAYPAFAALAKQRHDLVADRLDHATVALLANLADDVEATPDHRQRHGVAERLVQACAARDIREEDGSVAVGGGFHAMPLTGTQIIEQRPRRRDAPPGRIFAT